jgi:hypothetical protein
LRRFRLLLATRRRGSVPSSLPPEHRGNG